jgi:GTPase
MKFVDLVRIFVRAGDGGAGAVSFRREKYVPKGGPDGGNGGNGGSVILKANRHLSTLLDFQYRHQYRAQKGEDGHGANKTGKSGDDTVIEVPEGTIIRNTETSAVLADLVHHGQEATIARGGRGGRGNDSFKSATNQAPRQHEPGESGEEREIELELKLLADVGLVGLPNAGKSTLISVISAAKPKIADYPFTTLVPVLGIVRYAEGASFVVADIPGLIEGAHEGRGLGIQFLRHIERTRVLVFLLDVTRDSLKEDYDTLKQELRSYDPALVRRRRIIALTKIDSLAPPMVKKLGTMSFGRTPVFLISSVAGTGVKALVQAMGNAVRRTRTISRER